MREGKPAPVDSHDGYFGRLAFRREGEFWVCNWLLTPTMEGPPELARIRNSLIEADPMLKRAFIRLCQGAYDVVAREALGAITAGPSPPTPARDK